MERVELEKNLVKAMAEFEIIDCHEHLGPERRRTDSQVDVFDLISSYTRLDLLTAGMTDSDYQSLHDRDLPLEQRWSLLKPFWEQIRWGSYARVVLLAAERFYGFDDVNDDTYGPLSEAVAKANKPGLYERVLRDACRIRTALTLSDTTQLGTPLLTPLVRMGYRFSQTDQYPYQMVRTWEDLSSPRFGADGVIDSLDDYLDNFRRYLLRSKAEGVVGLKMASSPNAPPVREDAVAAFGKLRDGKESILPAVNPLRDYVVDQMILMATELDMVVAVHTGYWGDFRNVDPLHMIPILQRHPDTRFDIFHMGYPWPRQTLMLGKRFPNVWLNFCWMHAVSPRCAVAMWDEAIDVVPMNKLLAFGGDYSRAVELVYGHLTIARENLAQVLARRILDGQFNETQALALARKWFWHNPIELYALDLPAKDG